MTRNIDPLAVECPTCGAVPTRACKDMEPPEVHFTRAMAAEQWFAPCEHDCAQCQANASFDLKMNGAHAKMLHELGWLRRVLDGQIAAADARMGVPITESEYDHNRGGRQMAVNVLAIVDDILDHHKDAVLGAAKRDTQPGQQESR